MGGRTAERMTGVSVLMVSRRRSGELHYTAMQGRRLQRQAKLSGDGTLRPRRVILMRGRSGRARLSFIRARAIKARNGDVEQAEIDRELSAMVDVVIQDHPPNAGHARHVENFLA